MARSNSYKEHLHEQLQEPDAAAAYLNAALEDEDLHVFLLALRDITEAQGGMSHLAKETDLNRESLYKTLSMRGNPRLSSLRSVLGACGLAISIQPSR
ncbi:MAG: putative addiction module antidote protein [Chlamydiales bacterium]|nr:putative addiction module antidote protein [Chlamydiales bacterium]